MKKETGSKNKKKKTNKSNLTIKTWQDLVRKIWGYRRGHKQVEWLLWEGTSFPFIPNDWKGTPSSYIKKQLTELFKKAKGDFKTAQKISNDEFDLAWANKEN